MLEIQNNCKKEKERNPELRYQVRVGTSDLILMTKSSSSQTYWEETDINQYGEISELKLSSLTT